MATEILWSWGGKAVRVAIPAAVGAEDYVRYVVPIHNLTQWLFCSRDGSFKETQTEIVELWLEKQKGKNI